MIDVCELLRNQISSLYGCIKKDKYTRIRTPFLYPDGDIIDVFVNIEDDIISVSDLGETLRWLNMHTVTGKRTEKQNQLIADICLNHGIELYKGMLITRADSHEELTNAVTRLSQAALRAADIWFTFRTRAITNINDEVADFLDERRISYIRREKLPGRSGKVWTPDFHTRTPQASSLVYILSTGSKGASRGVVNNVVAAWYDLSHLKISGSLTNFVSLFDDTLDVWAEEDFNLVGDLSDVTRWSNPDEFAEILLNVA